MSRSVFDPVAEQYDASRPGYPDALFDAIESRARPLAEATVVEVGAGTGKATRELVARGARVLPIDVGAGMLAQLKSRSTGVPAVVGDGAALPVRDDVADLVACAQAFHWLPLERSLPEALRVLRPGGTLALWWNVSGAGDAPWMRRLLEQFRVTPSGYAGQEWPDGVEGPLHATGLVDRIEQVALPWEWRVPIESYLGYVGSKSTVVRLGGGAGAFLDEQRRELEAAFPDGMVTEPFTCRLTLAWPR